MKIGFVGLGIMGKPMAKNLLKAGYELVVYDVVAAPVDEVVKAGAKAGSSPKDVAAQADLIITMLPNSPHVKEAVLGTGGVLEGAKMAMAFNMLRSNDLIWSYVVSNYLKGQPPAAFDLLHWNSDATRMPAARRPRWSPPAQSPDRWPAKISLSSSRVTAPLPTPCSNPSKPASVPCCWGHAPSGRAWMCPAPRYR
mgnify:CR=1 FL=1